MTLIYSKKKVGRAGDALVKNNDNLNALEVLSYWRASHNDALVNAFTEVEKLSEKVDKSALLAKRLKRTESIINKLNRFGNDGRGMKLHRMQDIAGCRVILSNIKKVQKFIKLLKENTVFEEKNNYIEFPKEDGYRSVHFIGEFHNKDGETRCIELQVRTMIQHSWATAVEIVDLFTNQSIKTSYGKVDWKEFFLHVGTQFALLEKNTMIQTLTVKDLYNHYKSDFERYRDENLEESIYFVHKHTSKLDILKKFELFSQSLNVAAEEIGIQKGGYVLLVIDNLNKKEYSITTRSYGIDEFEEAKEIYLEEEKNSMNRSHYITALVSTSSIGDIKVAYPNYFADSTQFVKYLDIISYFYSSYFNVFETTKFWAQYR